LGTRILKESSLHTLLLIVVGDEHLLSRKRIYMSIEHNRRNGTRCGIIVLNLLRRIALLFQLACKIECAAHGGTGMA
jgi:hypothetical protein